MIEISPALIMYIESYSNSTAQLNAVAGALFAGAAFLTVRAAGVIKDDSLPALKWQWLPVGVMILAGLSMMMGYFVYERTAFFYSSIYQLSYLEPDVASMSSASNYASQFFDDEIRFKSLNLIVKAQIALVFLAGTLLVSWFIFNVRVKK